MIDAADLLHKAETCIRLAETASSIRTQGLFQRLADEYRMQAGVVTAPSADAMPGPSATGMPEPEKPEPVAPELAAMDAPEVSEPSEAAELSAPAAPDSASMEAAEPAPPEAIEPPEAVELRHGQTSLASPPLAPSAASEQWLAEFRALRARL